MTKESSVDVFPALQLGCVALASLLVPMATATLVPLSQWLVVRLWSPLLADKSTRAQRFVLGHSSKFVINVSRRSVRLSCGRLVKFCGALGVLLGALGDFYEIPPPMHGGVLSICCVTCCVVCWFPLQVVALLGSSSMLPLKLVSVERWICHPTSCCS